MTWNYTFNIDKIGLCMKTKQAIVFLFEYTATCTCYVRRSGILFRKDTAPNRMLLATYTSEWISKSIKPTAMLVMSYKR